MSRAIPAALIFAAAAVRGQPASSPPAVSGSAAPAASGSASAGGPAAKAPAPGQLPDDPAKALVQGKCLLCHSGEYITQQRLGEGAWQKEVEKMRKFGSPATDDEAKRMSAYLARYWSQEPPLEKPVRAAPPPPRRAR